MTLPFHRFANLFPMMESAAFASFCADVAANGLREKIVLHEGAILDGRNRYRAAILAGLIRPEQTRSPHFRKFDPKTEGDPLDWVVSLNVHRRHLDESQRAMVAAEIANLPHGGARKKAADVIEDKKGVTQAKAAGMLAVSERSLRDARVVREKGDAALIAAVTGGTMAVSLAAKAAQLAPALQKKIAQEAAAGHANVVRNVVKREARAEKEKALAQKQRALPKKKYGVILADPEWEFEAYSADTGSDRAASNHYPTSSEAEIAARDLASIAADDCLLILWTTDLARGLRVLEAWGFEYKSYFVWVKDIVETTRRELVPKKGTSILVHGKPTGPRTFEQVGSAGTGYWNLDRDELVLIGTRGNVPCPAPGTQGESVFFAARPKVAKSARGRHSAKPADIHEWIERHYPNLPKIELNARAARKGWDSWGNEVEGDG